MGYARRTTLSPGIHFGRGHDSLGHLGHGLFSPGAAISSSGGRWGHARDARWNVHAHGQTRRCRDASGASGLETRKRVQSPSGGVSSAARRAFASGIFLLILSDTELWPFGSQSWYFGLTHHAEVLQHKVFAVLLLSLGLIELQRERGALKAGWSDWVFPIVAAAGSLMLFFHDHQAGMHGPDHMEVMRRIQSEHFSFAMTGFGIALSKGLAEKPSAWQPFFERLFPTLLVVLGVLLMVYVE